MEDEEEVKSGSLWLREGGVLARVGWKEKWFVLCGRCLYWFKTAKAWQDSPVGSRRKRAKGCIPLVQSKVRTSPDLDPPCQDAPFRESSAFQIITPDGTSFSLCAQSPEAAVDWIHVIKYIIAGRNDLSKETVLIQEDLRKADFELDPDTLEFIQDGLIGAGASGIVKRGLWLKTEVAVKALKNLPELTDRTEMTYFYKEIGTLSKLRHINIVQMYGFCRKDNYICLVTEYVKGGNLATNLADKNNQLDFDLQIELAMSICRGMVYLHNQNVTHRDLKPANILIESWTEGKVKVCDFGISRVERLNKGDSANEETLGSPQYAAPELPNPDHDTKVDVFSFSIILLEIATRKMPWPEVKFGWEFAERYGKGERPGIPANCPFTALITKCWTHAPADRPTFVAIYEELERMKKGEQSRGKAVTLPSSVGLKPTPGIAQRPMSMTSPVPLRRAASSHFIKEHPSSAPIFKGGTSMSSMSLATPRKLPPTPGRGPVGATTPPPWRPQRPMVPRSFSSTAMRPPGTPGPPINRPLSPGPPTKPPTGHLTGPPTKSSTSHPTGPPPRSPPGRFPHPSRVPHPRPPMTGSNLPLSHPNSGSASPKAHPVNQLGRSMNPVEQSVQRLFDNKEVIPWDLFAKTFGTGMQTNRQGMEKLRHIFDSNLGAVEKATWEKFLQWFTPLSVSDTYQTNSSTITSGGYDIDLILEICSPIYFHGFLESSEAQRMLRGKPDGAYILRFSTQPGNYTLTVAYGGTVGHWRIGCEKKPFERPTYKIDGREYRNLAEIIQTHERNREPLRIKQPKPGQPSVCFLIDPLPRSEASDSYYQVM